MTDYMCKYEFECRVINYLDGFLMDKVRKEGKINDSLAWRMLHMLGTACQDGAAGRYEQKDRMFGNTPYNSWIFEKHENQSVAV